jgi:hypothetical protein
VSAVLLICSSTAFGGALAALINFAFFIQEDVIGLIAFFPRRIPALEEFIAAVFTDAVEI